MNPNRRMVVYILFDVDLKTDAKPIKGNYHQDLYSSFHHILFEGSCLE